MRTFAAVALLVGISASAQAGEKLSAAAYDRNKDGVLDANETLVWRLHVQDPILAKYDTNFNGRLDPEEVDRLRSESAASFSDRSRSVADDVSFF